MAKLKMTMAMPKMPAMGKLNASSAAKIRAKANAMLKGGK